MTTRRPPVTAKDVAALAQVSTATVSRVLSGRRPVTSDVRDKVVAAAGELGYVPNHFGSALRRKQSATLGVLVPRITNPFYPSVLEEIEAAAQAIDFRTLIAVSNYDVTTERQRLRELVGRNVDACVVVPASRQDSGQALREAHAAVPVIQFDGLAEGADVPHIGMDNSHAVSVLVEHLLTTGRRHIAFVTGGLATSPDAEREQAFAKIRATSTDSARFTEIQGQDFSFETGRRAADELAGRGDGPDAVICSNDMIALGLIQELERLGTAVPQELAVCGIDDISFAGLFRPTLTTVRQPLKQMAEIALKELLDEEAVDDGNPASQRFPGALVVRTSSRNDRDTT